MVTKSVTDYCGRHNIPQILVVYGVALSDSAMEFSIAGGNPKIRISPYLPVRMKEFSEVDRVWFILRAVVHELEHYRYYLGGASHPWGEGKTDIAGIKHANATIGKYTPEEINPHRNPLSLYQSFHGANPKGTRRINFSVPTRLVKIGRLKSLIYAPESPSKHVGTHFSHKFGDYGYKFVRGQEPVLAVSEDGKQLMIVNGKYVFGDRGIVG